MSDSAASREGARHILSHATTVDEGSEARQVVELFYSLVVLLPPTEVGAELLAKARRAAIGRRAAPEPAPSRGVQPRRIRAGGDRQNRLMRHVSLPLPALIALGLALLFTTTLLLLPRGSFEPSAALYLSGTDAARSARGLALLGDDEFLVFASGLSELERGYRYVAWSANGGTYRRLGTMTSIGNSRTRLRVPADSLPGQLEVTIEPSTSTGAPSGPTVLAGFAPDE